MTAARLMSAAFTFSTAAAIWLGAYEAAAALFLITLIVWILTAAASEDYDE